MKALVALIALAVLIAGTLTWRQNMQSKSKPDDDLKNRLTSEQYHITQEEGTERPFQNAYWATKDRGIYVDVVDGRALFSSRDKYDSGSGWPSFTKPIRPETLLTKEDRKLLTPRTEVRSSAANSHLGHVFDDGPGPDKKRFCINSGALRFIPEKDMEQQGYGEYLKDLD